EGQWDCTGLVESGVGSITLGIAVDERFEKAVLRAALEHVDLLLLQVNLGIDNSTAGWTDAAGELVEYRCRFLPLKIGL
ncbi:MAG: hypothetical protein PVF74_12395, partial [Anaerolineales bacterium]